MNNPFNIRPTHQRLQHGICASWLALLVLLALPCALTAQFSYTTGPYGIIITGYNGPGGAVTVPGTINGRGVFAIRSLGRPYDITSVTISSPIAYIEDSAFMRCSLTNVLIPNSVYYIGNYAFAFSGLTSVTIPGNVSSFFTWAFAYCSNLRSATISDGFMSISIPYAA